LVVRRHRPPWRPWAAAVGGQRLEGLGFDLPDDLPGIAAAGADLCLPRRNEPAAVARIETLAVWRPGTRMEIDEASRAAWSCVRATTASGAVRREGSLAGVLDRTKSPMGGRLLARLALGSRSSISSRSTSGSTP